MVLENEDGHALSDTGAVAIFRDRDKSAVRGVVFVVVAVVVGR